AIVKKGGWLQGTIAGSIAQVVRHARRGDDLAGVEEVLGVKRSLDHTEGLVDRRAEHFAIPFAPRQAVAVLAAESTAELQNQVGYILRDATHPGHLGLVFEIEQGANVETADARVPVKCAVGTVPSQQLAEAGYKFGQPSGRDGRVFHERHRFAVAMHAV